ncbi:ROK family protein [Fructilactobacillus sanfranciscensis]|uniref:ROK family protein n=1 Tax=Fructilactobacillus sanfranciscensis TaxID=1625 RepID=UPI0037566AA3
MEAGGTKFVCAVGDENFNVIDQTQFPTTTPDETLAKVIRYFKKFDIDAFGIASFGPIDVDKNSETYGWIIKTPKKGWSNIDFLGVMGAPEFGHIKVKRHRDDLDFKGICSWHGDCLEGVASGPTFEARDGIEGRQTPINDSKWNIIAYYVAQAVVDLTVTFRPTKVVLDGGVCTPEFIAKVRAQFTLLFNNYLSVGSLEKYITAPEIAHNGSATFGDFVLAKKALDEKDNI